MSANNKKSAGMIIMCIAVVVCIVSVILYGKSYNTTKNAYIFLIASAVVGLISALGAQKLPKLFNWGAPIAAVLACAGIAYSATVMADPIGYVIAGLYSMDTLTGFITFGVVALVAWLLYIVAGFTGMAKE